MLQSLPLGEGGFCRSPRGRVTDKRRMRVNPVTIWPTMHDDRRNSDPHLSKTDSKEPVFDSFPQGKPFHSTPSIGWAGAWRRPVGVVPKKRPYVLVKAL